MYHIAICDDDEVFIQYIKRLFGESSCAAEEMVFLRRGNCSNGYA